MKKGLSFEQVENEEDLQFIKDDINKSGGDIVESIPNYNAETAEIIIEINDRQDFVEKFKLTESFIYSYYGETGEGEKTLSLF